MKETITELYQQANQCQKAKDYCLQHGCVPHLRRQKAKKKQVEKGIGSTVQSDLDCGTLQDTTNDDNVTVSKLTVDFQQ